SSRTVSSLLASVAAAAAARARRTALASSPSDRGCSTAPPAPSVDEAQTASGIGHRLTGSGGPSSETGSGWQAQGKTWQGPRVSSAFRSGGFGVAGCEPPPCRVGGGGPVGPSQSPPQRSPGPRCCGGPGSGAGGGGG